MNKKFKDNLKLVGGVFLTMLIISSILVVLNIMANANYMENQNINTATATKECYRYITVGGILGGITSVQTSCNGTYDYYYLIDNSQIILFPIYRYDK